MRYHELRESYAFSADGLVYHGSKQRGIKDFIKKKGIRAAFFDTHEVMANGFFFALDIQDARSYGPYVSSYRIATRKPLVFGHDGVDPIYDTTRKNDLRYVLAATLERMPDGDFVYRGLTNDIYVKAEDIANNDLPQDDDWIYSYLGSGGLDWEVLDNFEAVARMRKRGYDSTVVYENGVKTNNRAWFVMDANQIQFVAEVYPPQDEDDE